ncbi:TerB family tellurite resistance protein [Aliiroseovarius crassostreae]|uniref:TerB family tellurite resistance protein n=1 Tax=Aliiroseovarius crassostreae TaxID=154981 RepID=A0A9Q9LYF6_9RHOB|nr:TerB family tellurite resistance protein [Aliiroseovarius crassostreae]UWP88058.1 TerB family tellurite resistance protein [Aliiroseovarius crassostreae]UWP91213.1 TerB family tellurite resistance protein [Aliiroseovarius crassostreae]UWP94398.1 TerB family tellurite resistance protein [Aliiroseovarius crassostreae]UWP97523.1 TerB family tellurite resistance protein [Aliiroseovarius crassostreae]UWQ00678.1 TerB family tellurite resistance protein [Aliiroseovarius crassostreae]
MIASLFDRLFAPAPAPLNQDDARLALSALLVRLARSDGDYAATEIAAIDAALTDRYGLSPDAAAALRHQAETFETQAPDTVRFTRAIKDAVGLEDRVAVIEAAWSVVLADGTRAEEEDALMRMVAHLLGVNDRDSNLARIRAQKG